MDKQYNFIKAKDSKGKVFKRSSMLAAAYNFLDSMEEGESKQAHAAFHVTGKEARGNQLRLSLYSAAKQTMMTIKLETVRGEMGVLVHMISKPDQERFRIW